MKILVLHGPNLNLLGLKSVKLGTNITLDKVNHALRREVRNSEVVLKILQTHDEAKAVTFLHRNSNKAQGLLFAPGPWNQSGVLIKDTLEIIQLPYVTVHFEKTDEMILNPLSNIINENPINSYIEGLKKIIVLL